MKPAPLRHLVLAWLALLALLAATCASAFFPLGVGNVAINYGIAALKALIVALVFMKLRRAAPMVTIAALAGVFMLAILVVLALADFLTRTG